MGERLPWKVSLHGGHSGLYCDHAEGTLREIIEAAIAFGYDSFGFSEHAPRMGDHLLYHEEIQRGWDVAKISADFRAYADNLPPLIEEYADRITLLRGFECEVVPNDSYAAIMSDLKTEHHFDYMVGSVHHIHEISIDGPRELFEKVLSQFDSDIEALTVHYYGVVAEMIHTLKPEVVAHLDLVRKNAPSNEAVDTPLIRAAALQVLDVIREHNCILDINAAGIRKGLGTPYPAPWLLRQATGMGIPCCFGDDSHSPDQVGENIDTARTYLLENDIQKITNLVKEDGVLVRKEISLD